jgi:Mor family transcriptional regulator
MSDIVLTPQDRMFLALILSDGMTVVPEIFKILGKSSFLKFIDLFGGQTVNFPTRERIERALRDIDIYQSSKVRGDPKRQIAEEHGITPQQVGRIIEAVENAVQSGAQDA